MKFNGTTVPTHRDDTYDTSEVSRYKSSGGSDIEVEALDVTENGIYTAPDGKAYSSVNVNVAGGGSSDFSTATVTVVNNIHSDAMCYAATVVEPPVPALPSTTTGFFNVSGNDTTTETVILYMGNCDMSFETSGILSGSGDVEIDGTNAYITGDCTITIS